MLSDQGQTCSLTVDTEAALPHGFVALSIEAYKHKQEQRKCQQRRATITNER